METALMVAFAVLLFFGVWVLSGWLLRGPAATAVATRPESFGRVAGLPAVATL